MLFNRVGATTSPSHTTVRARLAHGGSTFLDKELFDTSITCYTDPETELARRLARDVAERGGVAETIKAGEAVRHQQYETYCKPLLDQADILINQSHNGFVVERTSL